MKQLKTDIRGATMRTCVYVACVVGVWLLSCGCRTGTAQGAEAQNWEQHKNPLGFVVRHPKGWVVETEDDGRILVRSADRSAFTVIQPFFLRESVGAQEWLGNVPTQFASLFPEAILEKSEQRRERPDEAVASLAYSINGKPGRASLLCSIYERSGMFYAVAAPREQFAEKKKALVKILETFSFTQPAASAKRTSPDGGLEYVRWKDPKEGAFDVEVPKGWRVSGGLFRFASVDVRPAMELVSPDGQIRITVGDAALPPFSVPTALGESLGFREGSRYSPGYGVEMIVRRYVPGVAFAKEYVQARMGRAYSDLRFTEVKDRPDAAEGINRINAQYGGLIATRLTTGQVAFTCQADGRPMRGYYFAGTQLTHAGEVGIWNVQYLYGYVAAEDRVAMAQAVMDRIIRTARPNPDWVAMQQGLTANTSRIVADTNAYVSKIISDSYWNTQRSRDDLMRKWSNMTLGLTDVTDPDTGETWKVASGHNYYWRRGDTIVGTDVYDRPDIDFSPLKEW